MNYKIVTSFVFAGALLFFASSALADFFYDPADCLEPVCCQETIGKVAWQFQLIYGPEFSDDVECQPSWEECYKFTYEVLSETDSAPQSSVYFTIPYAGPEELGYEQVDIVRDSDGAQALVYNEPGDGGGDNSENFAKDVEEIRVLDIPFNSANEYSFYSNVEEMSRNTAFLKSGKSLGSCPLVMPDAYGFKPNEINTVAATTIIRTSDGEIYEIEEYLDTQCIKKAWQINEDGTKRELIRDRLENVFQAKVGDGNDLEFAGLPNQKCNRGMLKTKTNTWYFTSGGWVWR